MRRRSWQGECNRLIESKNKIGFRRPVSPGDRERIGFLPAVSLVTGNMVGSGIFLLPATLALYGGISLYGWLLTTGGVLLLAVVFARLSRIVHDPGGPYSYTREAYGLFPAFLVAWGYWVSIWCGNAAIAVAGTSYLGSLVPGLEGSRALSAIISVAVIWLFTLVNTARIRSIAGVQVIATLIKIVPLLVMATAGFLYFDPANFRPMNLSGLPDREAVTATAALTLWAFLGIESATIPSHRVRNPGRLIPAATITGTLVAAVLYIGSTTAVMGIVEPGKLVVSGAPFADAAAAAWGRTGSQLFAAAAVIACYGALNGWILLQGQMPLSAARDRLLPPAFGRVTAKGAPLFGLVLSSILATLLVVVSYSRGLLGMFRFMIMLSTLTVLTPYLFCSVAEIAIVLKSGFSSTPLRKILIPLATGLPALAYSAWAVAGLGIEVILWGIALLAVGIPVFVAVKKGTGPNPPWAAD